MGKEVVGLWNQEAGHAGSRDRVWQGRHWLDQKANEESIPGHVLNCFCFHIQEWDRNTDPGKSWMRSWEGRLGSAGMGQKAGVLGGMDVAKNAWDEHQGRSPAVGEPCVW